MISPDQNESASFNWDEEYLSLFLVYAAECNEYTEELSSQGKTEEENEMAKTQ